MTYLYDQYSDINQIQFNQNFDDAIVDGDYPLPDYNNYYSEIEYPNTNMPKSKYNFKIYENENSQPVPINKSQNLNQSKISKSSTNKVRNINKNYSSNINKNNNNNMNIDVNSSVSDSNYHTQSEFKLDDNEDYKLIPQTLILNLKDEYTKQKGYMQTNAEELFKFFLNYRVQENKGIKINKKIKPLMKYSNGDINYSIEYYNKFFLDDLQSQINRYSEKYNINQKQNSEKDKAKFTKETMRRLYPNQKELDEIEEKEMNVNNFQKFFSKLLDNYEKKNLNLTNDEKKLIEFWKSLSIIEKNKKRIQWEYGVNNLENELQFFLSDDEIINRLSKIFKKATGTKTLHPKPLIDYWENKIKPRDRYYKGLYKYDKKKFYNLIEEKYNIDKEERENEFEILEEERIKNEIIDRENRKLTNEEVIKLFKRFDELSKPKDKYKTGRVMISLKNQFKYDNIIKKMIDQEFRDYRTIVYPEGWEVNDKDKEIKALFKHLKNNEKGILNDSKIKKQHEKNKKYMIKRNNIDIENEKKEKQKLEEILIQDRKLNNYIKSMVIKYYKKMQNRIIDNNKDSISKYLNQMEQYIRKKYPEASKRKFGNKNEMNNQNSFKYKKLHKYYSDGLKYYFFKLLHRLGVNEKGKFIFAKSDNLSFWGPSKSNNCKIHTNNCPLYCIHNSHNNIILEQREKNFNEVFNNEKTLEKDEKFNMWKRPELNKEKEKIFMCLSDAKQCTFEPNINKSVKDINKINNMNQEELIEMRVNNDKWVGEMGKNLTIRYPIIYKEGICRQAKLLFNEGKYNETIELLEKAFSLDDIKAYFDPKFALYLNQKREAERIKNELNKNKKKDILDLLNETEEKKEDKKKKIEVIPDNFDNLKNKEICSEVYSMIKSIEYYRKNKQKEAEQLQEEISMIEFNKQLLKDKDKIDVKYLINPKYKDSNPQFTFIKDKYFNYFKTIMCPLKSQCPLDSRPRWPHSDINLSVQFGGKCPYAHQISELKFEQEINGVINSRKEVLKNLEKNKDPCIEKEWKPSGPLFYCSGCGKNTKGKKKTLCNFCKYQKLNDEELLKNKINAKKSNEKILKKINYKGNPEEIDQDYMKKFGLLKKAIILYNFRRYTDCNKLITQLHETVIKEQKEMNEKYKILDEKWRKNLNIKRKIPKDVLNYRVTQSVLDHFNIKIPLSTFLIYSEKMKKGSNFSIYNRHTYLNIQIEDFYLNVKNIMAKYDIDIAKLKERILLLEIFIKKGIDMEIEDPEKYEKLNTKYKTFKNHMCKKLHPDYTQKIFINGKEIEQDEYDREEIRKKFIKCLNPYNECEGAHNPNQLNLISPLKDKLLMENNVRVLENEKIQSRIMIPWTYPKQGYIEKKPVHKENIRLQYDYELKRSKSEKKFNQKKLEDLKIPFHEI